MKKSCHRSENGFAGIFTLEIEADLLRLVAHLLQAAILAFNSFVLGESIHSVLLGP